MAYTSDKKPGGLTQVTSLGDNDNVVVDQGGDVKRATLSQLEGKMFDGKTDASPVTGTEVVVVRKTDDTIGQVALNNIVRAGLITNAMVSDSAAIADTKLDTINTAGKVTNQAVQATSALVGGAYNNGVGASKIVTRDSSGNFAAGTITATLSGNASTATSATTATQLATGRTISLSGDVTYTSPAFDGSANITAAATIANDAVTTAKILDGSVTLAKLVAAVQQALVPAGAVQAFAMNSTPSGWLACNGSLVSRSTYAALFSAIGTTYGAGDGSTTFGLPDLRGYFVRGSGTNADGVASGTFGAKQADALATHTHSVSGTTGNDSPDHSHSGTTDTHGGHTHGLFYWQSGKTGTTGSVNTLSTYGGIVNYTDTAGAHSHNFSTGGASARHQHSFSATSGNPSTGTSNETRPDNIALLYCIKF